MYGRRGEEEGAEQWLVSERGSRGGVLRALRKWNYFGDLILFLGRLGPDSNNKRPMGGEPVDRNCGNVYPAEAISYSKIFFGIRKGDERDVEPRIVFSFLPRVGRRKHC